MLRLIIRSAEQSKTMITQRNRERGTNLGECSGRRGKLARQERNSGFAWLEIYKQTGNEQGLVFTRAFFYVVGRMNVYHRCYTRMIYFQCEKF